MSVMQDAQRLVSMSLGKLACSRSQRGGQHLHKALLLSTVLHKAREAFISENMRSRQEEQTIVSQQLDQVVPEAPIVQQPVVQQPIVQQPIVQQPVATETPEPVQCAKRSRSCAVEDKENSTPSAYEGALPGDDQPSKKLCSSENIQCEKRKLAQDGDDCPEKKRPKLGNKMVNENSDSKPEPMDCIQISSLVNRFNSGLSACLTIKTETNEKNETQSSKITNCRTIQVKEGFEAINRSAIALTV